MWLFIFSKSCLLAGVQRRHEKAMHYFELAASENDWQAIFQLGVMYYDGIHCEPDMVRTFQARTGLLVNNGNVA